MRLVADDAVDDVRADLLEASGPVDVGLFVEARHQLDHHRDRPCRDAPHRSGMRMSSESAPVRYTRLLDRHARPDRLRPVEKVHHRFERLEGWCKRMSPLADGVEHILPPLPDLRARQARTGGYLGRARSTRSGIWINPHQIYRAVHPIQIVVRQSELLQQEIGHLRRAHVGDFESHGCRQNGVAATPPAVPCADSSLPRRSTNRSLLRVSGTGSSRGLPCPETAHATCACNDRRTGRRSHARSRHLGGTGSRGAARAAPGGSRGSVSRPKASLPTSWTMKLRLLF